MAQTIWRQAGVQPTVRPGTEPPGVGTKSGEAFGLPPLLLIKPVRSFLKSFNGRPSERQVTRREVVSQKVEAALDAADEGLVRVLFEPEFAERWISSLRRDCLDHVIAINERQLRRVIRLYVDCYHADQTHLGLEKDAPEKRPIQSREMGEVIAFPRVGGLHHRYTREPQRAA